MFQQRYQEDLSLLLPAAVLARPLPPHQGHAQGQGGPGHLQILPQDLPEQELARLPHLEIPQAGQGAHWSHGRHGGGHWGLSEE